MSPDRLVLIGSPHPATVNTGASQQYSAVATDADARQRTTTPVPVVINPGDSIQSAVRVNPAGTTFLITRGVHRRQVVRPRDGMSFIGEAGAVLDGENAATQAFDASRTKNVTVRGLRITRYVPPELNGAIEGPGSDGWIVEDNEIDHNANGELRAYGVSLGSHWIVRRNIIHHNGWLGIAGHDADGTLIEGNELYANPPGELNDTVGEAANMKLFDCGRIVVRGNYVHDSLFHGIWVDTMRPDVTIEQNRVVNHGRAGIWYEVSYRGVIRDNYVDNAGYDQTQLRGWLRGGGIEVTNSPDVSVLDNTVVNSLNGIIGLQATGYNDGRYGKNELRNLLVQGNTIVMPHGQSGIMRNTGTNAVFTSWNNRFVGNRFELGRNPTPFAWMGRDVDERQWQAFGQGANDTFAR
jgi:nitrous oxidase accessory protein NosD